jgi:hypothetical protein
MEYYSAIKKNEIMSFAGNWMDHHVERDKPGSERQRSYVSLMCRI